MRYAGGTHAAQLGHRSRLIGITMTYSNEAATQAPLHLERLQLGPMANFVYLLVPTQRGRLVVVDPAWDVPALLARADELGRPLTDIVLTHHHADHRNGVEGLLERFSLRIHVQRAEKQWLRDAAWLSEVVWHDGGDVIELGGGATVTCLATPGHTPGSQCLLCNDNKLLTGDTLFIDGCGRCDLPGGDAGALFKSLANLRTHLPKSTLVLPGHDYGPVPEASWEQQESSNPYLQLRADRDFVDYRLRPRS